MKRIIALSLLACLLMLALSLTSCDGKCAHIDADGNSRCDLCGEECTPGKNVYELLDNLPSISGVKIETNEDMQSFRVVGIGVAVGDTVVIPSAVNGYPVTDIGRDAFRGYTGIKAIIIPKSIKSIKDSAFQGLSELESIRYEGTSEEWQAIEKGFSWNYQCGDYTITYNYKAE